MVDSVKRYEINNKPLIFLIVLYITISIACDVVGYKLVGWNLFIVNGGALLWPLTYIFIDTIAEVYGYNTAKYVIWLGLTCEVICAVLIVFTINVPGVNTEIQNIGIRYTLGNILRYVVASIISDLCSAFTNAYIITKLKIKMHGRHFIFRAIIALISSESVNSFISVFLAFIGGISILQIIELSFSGYLYMFFLGVLLTVPTRYVIQLIRKIEKTEYVDNNIIFNPFKF